MEITPSKKDKA
ncbi:hypothetical protein CGLO_13780 [Colletotrichum gloeosporioides Cg-14]|uniref:Uncharacterized protein n=1 Tax=Colletotrichum gloeosporioides (strain Cg-14) TaxID=1237896 RepID=T0JVS6_COLGC|nr:hypothetical protein CGLO_13780 [Colletotrichum gloeosporioides Cg-14]